MHAHEWTSGTTLSRIILINPTFYVWNKTDCEIWWWISSHCNWSWVERSACCNQVRSKVNGGLRLSDCLPSNRHAIYLKTHRERTTGRQKSISSEALYRFHLYSTYRYQTSRSRPIKTVNDRYLVGWILYVLHKPVR